MVDSTPGPVQDGVVGPLLLSYRDGAPSGFVPPPTASIAARGRRRSRRQVAVGAVAAVTVAVAVGAVLTVDRAPLPPQPPVDSAPAPSPSLNPSTSPGVSASPSNGPGSSVSPSATGPQLDITTVDWANVTLQLPPNPDSDTCPAGAVTVKKGRAVTKTKVFKTVLAGATGDLDRDGHPEAVVFVMCERNSEFDSGDGAGQLLVVTVRGKQLVGLDYVGPEGYNYDDVRIAGGRLRFTVAARIPEPQPQQRSYRWNGSRFVQLTGPTALPS